MTDYSDIIHTERPHSAHPKMDIGNRAKQFIPMDALRGFSVAVLTKQREKQLVPRACLSEDAAETLDWRLRQLREGDTVTVTYFQPERNIGGLEVGTYTAVTGQIIDVDSESGALVLSNVYVPFGDIYQVESGIFDRADESEVDAEPE